MRDGKKGNTGKVGNAGNNNFRNHRAYRDPTADIAIANVMREERMKKRAEQWKTTVSRKHYGTGGNWHAAK